MKASDFKINFTPTEYYVFNLLLECSSYNKICSRKYLEALIIDLTKRDTPLTIGANRVDNIISRIRSKIKNTEYSIHTKRGYGYYLKTTNKNIQQ